MIRLILLLFFSCIVFSQRVDAHPMGNFSINHSSTLSISKDEVDLRYILDFAEIPTFQEIQKIDLNQNGETDPSEREAYLADKAASLAAGLLLNVRGETLSFNPRFSEIEFSPGAGGLPTMLLSIAYRATLPGSVVENNGPVSLSYRDENYPSRVGWKEMAAAGRDGISLIGSSLPTRTDALRSYPEEELQSPPQIIEARFSFAPGSTSPAISASPQAAAVGGGALPEALRQTIRNDRFAALMTGAAPTGPMLLFALFVSFALGALHALSPGHGKTIVAAYLVGARGTARHAFFLGVIVTASHTIGVFLLGGATLFLSKYIVPERLYPWLGLLSGLSIVIIGLSLLRQRWKGIGHRHANPGDHDHPHHYPNKQHGHDHAHGHSHGHPHAPTLSALLGLGVSGGSSPCPSALVVLLSAIAFHQVAFGMLLIVAFSAGLAATLVAIGLVMVYLGGIVRRFERFGALGRLLPVFSAAGVTLLGGAIAIGSWIG